MFKHKNFKCTNDGVSNYFWPVSRDKVARLIRRMVKESAYHLKNVGACEENKFHEDLKLINMYLLLKMSELYQKKVIDEAIRNTNSINFDLSIFDDDITKNNNKYINIVKTGFRPELTKVHKYQKLRNYMATLIKNDGFTRRRLFETDESEGIICTGVSPLASVYQKQVNQPASLIKIVDFFPGVDSNDIQAVLKRKEHIQNMLHYMEK